MLTLLRLFSSVKIRMFGFDTTLGQVLDALKLAQEAYLTLRGEGTSHVAAKEDAIDTMAVTLNWRQPPQPWADTYDRHTAGGG